MVSLRTMRQTKIIATIGPASCDPLVLEQLINAGVDICRLNFSHGSHEAHAETFHRIRAAAATSSSSTAVSNDCLSVNMTGGSVTAY